ncbi:hypothetical protein DPMN_004589 [Dreissena polymorpha]|uniref:Uncharacterized protein n=1 Tax=Dreissena polymorpha TaxID=45954 RepID=A0A9D4MNT2_DREPO|nr:hypothetical protein DPMN_004589 [Dreissena polymorpha]
MSSEASTPNTANTGAKTKRTISVLSTPEQGGYIKKNRLASGSCADFYYTFESMDDAEKVDFKLDDKAIQALVKDVEDSIESSLSMKMKSMVESIVSGVVDGLSMRIECLEIDKPVAAP